MPQGEGSINIPAILMVNLMGLIVLFAIAIGTDWRSVRRTNTVKALLFMTVSIALACIMEPLAYWQDGTNQAIGYLLNTLIYFIYCNLSVGWLMMVASHLDVKLSKLRKCLLGGYVIVSLLVLIANLFVPIVFSIDAQGVYTRSWGYFYLLAVGLLVAFDGVYIAYRAKRRSSNIKFFPVWAFLVPALLGRLIQTLWYGMSTAVPFLAISVGCCALCLQNERLHRDSHTNLFNRSYLSALEVSLSKRATHAYTAIFIDVNCFKSINDTYGHLEGDKALIRLADVLRQLVADKGEVIRYAGDEFFILLNSSDKQDAENLLTSIDTALDKLPLDPRKPYRLSVSAGFCPIDFRYESMDNVLDRIDQLMYEKKREYYRDNQNTYQYGVK